MTLQVRGETRRRWLPDAPFSKMEKGFHPLECGESILAYATFGLNFLCLQQPGFWPNIHCTSVLSLEEQRALSRSEKNVLRIGINPALPVTLMLVLPGRFPSQVSGPH